ncbi:transcriptional regulator [Enterococcus sp. BWB1-3]|uniref:transcriptional regulator GutM n=1 Tax=unclassified Enterococcus TaxID=2608891 RepID=UPI0019248970|nr:MULTISPECIES: transcriptional regulator GutM [unclassified Enterococcus]MBL1229355.1 transcriptional regulator [Enterococcus sp. BWB1-3]MCB5956116.1 transcriptional regulator GutM [Enterococcus sp. CWB-B31]
MGEYLNLIVLLVSCWLLQLFFSYIQHKNYQKVINENKYRQSGYLGVGIAKTKFNLGKGSILILVTDDAGTILDFQEMSGFTVFSRFKKKETYIGKNAEGLLNEITNKQRLRAYEQALGLIKKEIMKMEEQVHGYVS